MEISEKEVWPYGQPGVIERALSSYLAGPLRSLMPKGPVDPNRDVDVAAGCKCMVVELFACPSDKQMKFIESFTRHQVPEGYAVHILRSYQQENT